MLENLYDLVKPIKQNLEYFKGTDCVLPKQFISANKTIGRDSVEYGRFTSIVTNANGQHIYLSNNWFYIAAFLSPLYKPFEKYRKKINDIVDKDTLKTKNAAAISAKVNRSQIPEVEKELLIKFATDYEWWTAGSTKDGKSLDRNDCLVSAVLAIANVVNNSQSYISTLWNYFGDNPSKAQILLDKAHEFIPKRATSVREKKLTDFMIKAVKFLSDFDKLAKFAPYAQGSKARNEDSNAVIIKLKSNDFPESLVGFLIDTDLADIKKRNTASNATRWFEDPINFNGRNVFLSNQWNESGNYQLTLPEFKKYVEVAYEGRFMIDKDKEGYFTLTQIKTANMELSNTFVKYTASGPHHLIYYGAPGTAKSTSIKKRTEGKEVHRVTFHPDTDYAAFVGCYKPTQVEGTGEITYKFVAQAFVNAYVSAWKKLYDAAEEQKDVFLIIEEINRGNCAQIFGDLFQALDRNTEGYSEYPIEPDQDLARYLREAFEDSGIEVASIKNGSALLLPPNLFIWATMNTSDQSLFPIDSAFKRRWGWKYLPIRNDHKGHVIGLQDGRRYDWWEFLEAVNSRIEKVTESEDKQLGYWFAKPDYDTIISADTMVGKVVFYLWNDVFKDYFRDANSPFTIKEDGEKKRVLKFREFYDEEGNVREDVLALFIEGMKLSPLPVPSEPDPEPSPATETEEDVLPEVREDETPSDAPAIETVTAPIPTLTTTPAYEEEEEEETTDPTAFFNS